MSVLEPLALWGLLFIPLLVIFYLFRPDPRRRGSTSYFLWKAAAPESAGGTFANRFQNNPLFWLQLLFLLLMLLFLARLATPWVSQRPNTNRVILMIDRSASMAAQGSFESARRKALEAVDDLLGMSLTGSRAEVMLIAVDSEPRVLVPFTQDESTLVQALRNLEPVELADGLDQMGPFVRSLIKAHRAKIWIFGDHLPESLRVAGVQYSSVAGQADDNVGVVSFSVRPPDPERGWPRPFVYARVENFSSSAQQRLVRIEKVNLDKPEMAEATVLEKPLLLPAGNGQTLVESISAARFEVDQPSLFRLTVLPLPGQEPDALRADDAAYTVVAPFREEEIVVATTEQVNAGFLLRAIAASSDVKVVKLADYLKQPGTAPLNLLIAPVGFQLPSGLRTRSLFTLAPPPGEGATKVEPLSEVSVDTPLVGDSGIEWTRQKVQVTSVEPPKEGEIVLLSSATAPALTLSGLSRGIPTLHWRFPLEYSSLPLSSGLPVVVGRFLDNYSRHSGVPYPGSLSAGQSSPRPNGQNWRGKLSFKPLTSGGRELEVAESAVVVSVPERAGVYELRGEKEVQPVAVNLFSYAESRLPRDLEDRDFGEPGEVVEEKATQSSIQYKELGWPLLLMAFLILVLETVVFLKRGRP